MTKKYEYADGGTHMSREERREHILAAALQAAIMVPYYELRREEVGACAGVAPSSINVHFQTMNNLRQEMLKRAIETENVNVLKRAIGRNEPLIEKMPKALKEKVVASLIK